MSTVLCPGCFWRRVAATCFLTAVIGVAGGGVCSAKTVRVFTVANRLSMTDIVSYQSFRDKMFAMMDATFPGRAGLVEAGVDDVASHIGPADSGAPALVLVNFPEDVGLAPAFIGSRGAVARSVPSSVQAYLTLFNTYRKPRNFYKHLFLLNAGDLVPQIVMAVTDTVYRAFYETFRDIAVTYGVYVSAGMNAPQVIKVTQSEDPQVYNTLIDPDEVGVRDYVYKAISSAVFNTTFLFMPDGQVFVQRDDGTTTGSPAGTDGVIRGSANKVYLTPIELNLLKLFDAPIDELDVLDTPVGRIGVVISKDAWMTDINDRLAARHAHLMLQSEAFSSWAFQTEPWDPDIFKQGGYNNLQKYQTRLFNVAPSLTGNLFEITFDGQSAILGRGHKGGAGPLTSANAWIGQNSDTGFLAVAPWIMQDPGIDDPSLTLADRRSLLSSQGNELRPDSGTDCGGPLVSGACKNGYRESVLWTDVVLPDGRDVLTDPDPTPPLATAWGSSVQVNDDDTAAPSSQLYPRIAVGGGTVYVVWQDTRNGNDNVYVARSTDGGLTWSSDVRVSDAGAGQFVELLPDIAFHRDPAKGVATVYIVWQQLGAGGNDNDAQIRLARFDENLAKLGADLRVDDIDGVGKWRPAITTVTRRGHPVVVWSDERNAGPKVSVLEHLRIVRARGRRGPDDRPKLRFRSSRPVVRRKTVDRLAEQLANEWAPAIASDGRRKVYVAWMDFRSYNWDVYAGFSRNGGRRFQRISTRVDDSEQFERLNSHPSLTYDESSGRLLLVWSDQRERQVDTNIFYASSSNGGRSWSTPSRLDTADTGLNLDSEVPSNQWQPEVTAAGGRACVAWQDNRLGNNDIFASLSLDAGTTFAAEERVDDSGAGASEQFTPVVAVGSGRCYVAWSDNRSGDSDIRVASKAF